MTRPEHLRTEQEWLEHLARGARECGCYESRDLAPARGIVRGVVLGALCWALVILALFLILTPPAHGQPLRGIVTVAAWHEYRHYYCTADSQFHDFKAATPGLGLGADLTDEWMVAAGMWRTSHGGVSPFALVDWRPLSVTTRAGRISAGLFAGVSAGYCRNGGTDTPIALGGATVRMDFERVAVHVLALPPTNLKPMTIGLALSFPL